MRVLEINTKYRYGGSPPRIMYDLAEALKKCGHEVFVAYGFGQTPTCENEYCIESRIQRNISNLQTRLFDSEGFHNRGTTAKLLQWMDEIKPDVVHIHNMHGHYINVEMLFKWLIAHKVPAVITMHDCWNFTGHCVYFDHIGCEKWKSGCSNCKLIREYPITWLFDRSAKQYKQKKELFSALNDCVFVTPSEWLKRMASQSFLKDKRIEVINNGIDLSTFKPVCGNFREKYGIGNEKIVLSVNAIIEKRKGADYLMKLPDMLPDGYKVVMVGSLTQEYKDILPKNCIHIDRTENLSELVEIYSTADVFVNTTLTDNFPTVNIESLACGTPVVTFDVGGSAEIIDENTGIKVEKGDIKAMVDAILKLTASEKPSDDCRKRAERMYEKQNKFYEYINLFEEVFRGNGEMHLAENE